MPLNYAAAVPSAFFTGVSVFVSVFEASPFLFLGETGFESVQYQPDPLKMTAEFEMSRSDFVPQVGHRRTGASEKDCIRSNRWPFRQAYS